MQGLILWSFMEYILHRYLFHMNTENVSDFWKVFHFTIHGLHHKV